MAMKKIALTISSILLCVFLAIAILAGMLLTCSIAYAQDSQDVVVAPVSNLEGNAQAGKSAMILEKTGDRFYIPESYYVTDIGDRPEVNNYYAVTYCGEKFYYNANGTIQKQSIVFPDGVSPYPDINLTIANGGSLLLDEKSVNNTDYTIKFLGYSIDDDNKIYVMAIRDGEHFCGFAQRSIFESFTVPYHPLAEAERNRILDSKLPPEPEKGDIIPDTSLALRIVLIIGIAVPTVIIVLLLFKPSKKDRAYGTNQLRRNKSRNEFDYDSSRTYRADNPDYQSTPRYDAPDGYRGDNSPQSYGNYPDDRGYDSRRDDDYRNR